MRETEYMESLLAQIQCEKAKGMIEAEIRSHIEDQKAAYMQQGMKEANAEQEAVRQMGDPVEAGARLNRIHRPLMAWDLLLLPVFLSVLGLLAQYLLNWHYAESFGGMMLSQAIVYTVMGIVVMLGVGFLDYTYIGRYAKGIYLGLFGAAALLTVLWRFGGGRPDNIVTSIAMLYVPLFGCVLYGYRGKGVAGIVKSLLWLLPAVITLVLFPDTLSAPATLIIMLADWVMLSVAVGKNWFEVHHKWIIVAGLWIGLILIPFFLWGILAAIGGTGFQEYYLARFDKWIHFGTLGSEYWGGNLVPELLLQNQWIGPNRLLEAEQWTYTLPLGHDYVLAYVCLHYGILAALILSGFILLLLIRGLYISLRHKNRLGRMMGAGVATLLLIQFVFYFLCNIGILPSRIYFPFVTDGASGMIASSVLLGIFLSIYRYQNIIGEEKEFNRQAES